MSPTLLELSTVAAFVRQHTHDIRNHLTGLELEAAVLAETHQNSPSAEGAARMQAQIKEVAIELKALAEKFSDLETNRAPFAARELFLIWQDQAAALGLHSITWGNTLGDEKIEVDVAAVCDVLKELMVNAQQFTGAAGLAAMADGRGGKVTFELRETKREALDPSGWGERPFISSKRGGYGLGLWQAAQLVVASGGEVTRCYLPKGTLVTKVIFPLV
jgi:hypothetical protein